mgnify:CR=1 FL=1
MPKGSPSKQTIRAQRYQDKIGYISKGFKMKRELADEFRDVCQRNGVSQASVITEFMRKYIEENK